MKLPPITSTRSDASAFSMIASVSSRVWNPSVCETWSQPGNGVAEYYVTTTQLESEGVDVAVVGVIREIVSGSLQVIGGRVVAGQADDHVVEPVRVGFETQRHEQIAQRAACARDESDGDVVSPRPPQAGHGAASRTDPQHACLGEPGQLRGV